MPANDQIKQDFRTPGHPSAFSAAATVSRTQNIGVERARNLVQEIDSYVLHKETKRPRQYNPYYVYSRRELVQADLIHIAGLSKSNGGVTQLLLFIDVFSRKIHVYPLKSKSAREMVTAISKYINETSDQPTRTLMTDGGMEFWAAPVQALLRQHGINQKLATGTSKACYAERANKTLQILIYKYLTDRETTRYIDVLSDLVLTYNSRGHRSLNYMTPNDADLPENEDSVLAAHTLRVSNIRRKKPVLPLGSMVRVKTEAKNVDPARRAYAEQFKGEYFKIIRVNRTLPIPMYYLKSMNTGEIIDGAFYSNELSQARGDTFKIESVLRRRVRRGVREVFVKWKFFDARWNEWIPENQIVEVF